MDDWIMLLKDEYLMVRDEATQTDKNAQAILRFGLAIIGIVIGFGIDKWDDDLLSGIVFSVFVPILCYLFLTIWMGEFARKLRVAHYILEVIEPKINKAFASKVSPIEWESWLRKKDRKSENKLFKWNRFASIFVFLGFAVASIGVGLSQLYFSGIELVLLITFSVIEAGFLLIVILFNNAMGKKFK